MASANDISSTATPPAPRPTRLAFLISGGAAHVLAVAAAIRQGRLPGCEIAIVVCNVPGAAGIEAARAAGLQTVTMEGRGREQRDHEDAIDALLRKLRVDLVCLAGYLRVFSNAFLDRWPRQVLNVHSSLLPAFPRMHAAEEALAAGVRITGCTVFFLDGSLDGGAIIDQRTVSVEDNDTEPTLSARLHAEEQQSYVDSIARVVSGEYRIEGRRYKRL